MGRPGRVRVGELQGQGRRFVLAFADALPGQVYDHVSLVRESERSERGEQVRDELLSGRAGDLLPARAVAASTLSASKTSAPLAAATAGRAAILISSWSLVLLRCSLSSLSCTSTGSTRDELRTAGTRPRLAPSARRLDHAVRRNVSPPSPTSSSSSSSSSTRDKG